MNQRSVLIVLLVVVLAAIAAVMFLGVQGEVVVLPTGPGKTVATGTVATTATAKKRDPRSEGRANWVRLGPGTVVGILREYGTDRPLEGVEVALEAGLPGPNEVIRTTTRADGGFAFEKVTNFDAWTLRAKAPAPLADAELAGVNVIENRQCDVGTVYLAPAFGVPGIVVDEKDVPVPGATVRALRSKPPSTTFDLLRLIRELPTRAHAVDEATTGEDGRFELRKVPLGRYDFTVEKAGHQIRVETDVVVTPDAKSHPLKFVLLKGFTLDGTVAREGGGGSVAGIAVVAFHTPKSMTDFGALDKSFATTDEKGAFHLDGLGGGRYAVVVTPEGEPAVANSDVGVPAKKPIEIVLKGDCWLEGKIAGEGDRPIADAQVYAINLGNNEQSVGNVKTDADGHYVIRGLKSGPLQLFLVQAEGHATYPDDIVSLFMGGRSGGSDVKLVPGRNEKNVSLAKGGIVRGLVKEKGGDVPVAGARVDLTTPLALFGGSRSTTTGPDGRFELTSVPKGTAILMVSKDGWFQPGITPQSVGMLMMARMQGGGAQKDTGKGATIVVSEAGQVLERTLELAHGSSLSGVVTSPDGQPVSGAQVSLVLESNGNGMAQMIGGLFSSPDPRLTDAQGHYEIPGPPPGEKARVVARSTGWLDGKSDVVACAPGDTKADVHVKLRRGATLAGRVHDDANVPIAGALVRWVSLVDEVNGWSVGWRLRNASPTTTDAKGEFAIPNVEPGKLAIEVTEARHLPWSANDRNGEDGKTTDLDVTLKMGAFLEGTVIGVDGRRKAGATVEYAREGAQDPGWNRPQEDFGDTTTDVAGVFRVEGLTPGTYRLTASVDGSAPSDPVMAQAGGPGVTLTLKQAFVITGTVRVKGGAGVGDADVALWRHTTEAGEASGDENDLDQVQNVRTDDRGAFEFKNVPFGNFEIHVSSGAGASPRPNVAPATVKDVQAGRQGLVIEVEAGKTIRGQVFAADGNLVPGGWISAQPEPYRAGAGRPSAQIEEGNFELTGLVEGKYRLHAYSQTGQQKQVVAEAGATDVRIDFGNSGGSVAVHVTKLDGSAAGGVWVSARGEPGGNNAMTDAEGNCEIKGLGAGTYTVTASQGRESRVQRDGVVVRESGPTEVRLQFEK